eukprot:6188844-Pleurochrysis_carterae.AAC.3
MKLVGYFPRAVYLAPHFVSRPSPSARDRSLSRACRSNYRSPPLRLSGGMYAATHRAQALACAAPAVLRAQEEAESPIVPKYRVTKN